jgi:uncharacterized membrane protein
VEVYKDKLLDGVHIISLKLMPFMQAALIIQNSKADKISLFYQPKQLSMLLLKHILYTFYSKEVNSFVL